MYYEISIPRMIPIKIVIIRMMPSQTGDIRTRFCLGLVVVL